MGKLDEAQRHLNKPQAARAESTFREQPKAQKQPRRTSEEKQHAASKGKKRIDELHNPFSKKERGSRSPAKTALDAVKKQPDPKGDALKKKREEEKARRTKASGGTRQSQKRRQGNF